MKRLYGLLDAMGKFLPRSQDDYTGEETVYKAAIPKQELKDYNVRKPKPYFSRYIIHLKKSLILFNEL